MKMNKLVQKNKTFSSVEMHLQQHISAATPCDQNRGGKSLKIESEKWKIVPNTPYNIFCQFLSSRLKREVVGYSRFPECTTTSWLRDMLAWQAHFSSSLHLITAVEWLMRITSVWLQCVTMGLQLDCWMSLCCVCEWVCMGRAIQHKYYTV